MKTTLIVIGTWNAILGLISGNFLLETVENGNKISEVSEGCRSVLELYVENWKNSTDDMWALKMWDASSKVPVGLLSYNFGDIGNFKQCVETKSVFNKTAGKYCLGTITVSNVSAYNSTSGNENSNKQKVNWKTFQSVIATGLRNMGFATWAICTPSNCSDDDVLNILRGIQLVGMDFESVTCQTADQINSQLTTEAIIGILILSVIASIMVLSTCIDLYYRYKERGPAPLALITFSVYTNGENLFRIEEKQGELSFFNGMRFMSMIWILVGHTRFVFNTGPLFNSKDVIELKNSFFITILLSIGCAVDTFLVIGGVLVSYVFFKQNRNEAPFNIIKYYFHRYIRLTPSLAGVVLVKATVMRYLASGPEWNTIERDFERPCRKYWWSTFLYIENYVNIPDMCVFESWYLDVDMQLYLISPLILFFLNKCPKTSVALLVSVCLASIFAGFWTAYDDQLNITSFDINPWYFNKFYFQTHTRAPSWLIGIIIGFLLTRDSAKSVKISKVYSTLAWMFIFVVMTICVFGGHTILKISDDDRIGNAAFVAFQNPVWSICMGWMIWACATNHGGPINGILSYPIFRFMNQFTYSIYLLHHTVLEIIVYSQKVPFYYSELNLVFCSCGIFMFTFGLSIFWVLAFEKPVMVLQKKILKK